MKRPAFWGRALRPAAFALAAALLCLSDDAHALDMDPGDYIALPAGTDLALGYARFSVADRLDVKGGGQVPDSRLASQIGIAAYVHYAEVGGYIINPRIFVPFGRAGDIRMGGVRLDDAAGLGDPFVAATVWPVSQPDQNRYVGFSTYLFLPLGSYQSGRPFNIGENRWKSVFQVGFIQGVTPGLSAELTADATVYGCNHRAGSGAQTLSQDVSYQIQPWIRFTLSSESVVSLGYSGVFGGSQRLDGVFTGFATDAHTVRLDYRHFVTDTFQLAATVSHDVAARGGFQEQARLNLRVLKLL